MDNLKMTEAEYIFGSHDEKTLTQLADVASRAEQVALMADGHLGYIMPIGGVAAYDNKVSVAGVGYDIACGNAAIKTNLYLEDIQSNLSTIADQIARTIDFGVGRGNSNKDAPSDDPLFKDDAWKVIPKKKGVRERLLNKAKSQIGSVGSGNHYVDIFADENEQIWVGVHFGSRGFGHSIASTFMALAQGKSWEEKAPAAETLLDLDTALGQAYWEMMQLAGKYAYVGREWVARKTVEILGASELELVHNHHNFAWKEKHNGKEYIVVRKGATPAFPGQKGFVGGSMGDNAVILRGKVGAKAKTLQKQENALFSTVHGAGRVMSRTKAAGKRTWGKKSRLIKPGLISDQMLYEWLQKQKVILRGGGLDEAPQAYRRLPEVLASQEDTIEVLHTLKPLIVVMEGRKKFNPA